MERIAQSGSLPVISYETYQLAEKYQVGSPLGFYNMRPQVLCWYKWSGRIMLIVSLCVFFIGLIAFLITFSQLQLLSSKSPVGSYGASEQGLSISHLHNQLVIDLTPLLLGLICSVGAIIQMLMIANKLPASVLVCTKGLLRINPKKVDVTFWDEVTGLYRLAQTYQFIRINREPLSLGNALQDVDGLVVLIKQHIKLSSS